MGEMMRNRLGAALFALLAFAVPSSSFGQLAVTTADENIPKEIRNRADVQVLLEKLRFLRKNESILGQNHLNKQTTQTQIQEHEFDLANIIDSYKKNPKSLETVASIHVEDALPQSLANRVDAQAIVRKLRYLRMNDKNLGENHSSKKSTQEQIRRYEFALQSISELEGLPAPKSVAPEIISGQANNRTPQELENPREMRLIVQKLAVLKANQANYGENHPNWKIIQNEIREHESALRRTAD